MNNKQVARILFEIAQLLELQAENAFKIRAYDNAARAVENLEEDLALIDAAGRLQEIPGIGKAIAEKIHEVVTTGRMEYYDKLKAKTPASLYELLRVPNLGPKKIKILHDELGIKSMKQLEEACRQNRLVSVRGFGKLTQQKILQGISAASAAVQEHTLGKVLPVARQILQYLRDCNWIEQVEIAGSVRRWKEVVSDLDFVGSTTEPKMVAKYFLKLPFVASTQAHGDTKISLRLQTLGLDVDLRIVKPSEFACALHHFTGSKEHNVAMRAHAKRLGYKINEYGIFKEDSSTPEQIRSEEELYGFFKMQYIPPELREGLGEVEAALDGTIPQIISQPELKGIFHVHSTWSDGHDTLEQMIAAAQERGYEYVGISEHSQVANYAHGLDVMRLQQQSVEIDRLQKKYRKIRILKGSEVDILSDGSLDFPDEILARLDFVIGSVHSGFKMEEAQMTARICRALAHPHLDILGHATGRMLLRRKGYAVNLDEVIKTAAKYGKCIEINANPRRLDMDWRYVRQAREQSIRFAINPDAHYVHEFDNVEFGVGVARKGWVTAHEVVNTRPWDEVKPIFARKQRKASR